MDEKEINMQNQKENILIKIFCHEKKIQMHEMAIQYLEKKLKRTFGDGTLENKHPLYKKV